MKPTDGFCERQLQQIREIRLSERKFYQKVTDLYATAFDYDKDAKTTRLFFQTVQNKMHYAVHRHTSAELIYERADANKEHMGLTTWENAPDGKILKADVTVAKNYLSKEGMNYLEHIVSLYLDYAELQAERKIPMSMEDWAKRLDGFLEFNGNELLTGPGKISAEQAKLHAETEYEKYRIVQDCLYESDFDRFIENSIKAAQSKGYEQWAKIHNLKQAAKTMNFLTEHKIEQYADLTARIAEIQTESEQAADALKNVEKRLTDMAVFIKNISTYQKTKPVYSPCCAPL